MSTWSSRLLRKKDNSLWTCTEQCHTAFTVYRPTKHNTVYSLRNDD